MNRSLVGRQMPRALALLALALLALAACGSQGGAAQPTSAPAAAQPTSAPAAAQPTSAPAAAPAGDKPIIKLAENPWTGSSINVNVAKILLEEKLGYKVEIVAIDENAQWIALDSGDLSASLEVWPSGETHQKGIKQYIEGTKTVDNLGELGVVGKISWYVPSYVVEQHPELATWEGFKKPENAALFKTAETGEKGQFLAGDASWVQYDEDIIKNLGLDLQVVKAGSETAVLSAVDSAYSRKEPILFYFWTPHSIHAKYKLTPVKLPDYSDACYAKAKEGGVDCDYPKDILFKIASAKLKDSAPDAYQLLKNMKYTTDDQIEMIATVDVDKKSAADAARAWIDKHESVWSAWLPK